MRAAIFLILFWGCESALGAQSVQKGEHASDSPRLECVAIKTPSRLAAGKSFTTPIGRNLEFRLKAERGGRWWISVGPAGTIEDYLWVVSPPIQTAPHLQIGAGYNLSATQSARMTPRTFQFVTSPQEYDEARALVEAASGDAASGITVRDIEQKGKGSLELSIMGFEAADSDASLTWIRVRGRACLPL